MATTNQSQNAVLAAIVNQRDIVGAGNTLLHVAATHNNLQLAKVLIDSMADIDVTDNDGNTPLHLAASNNATQVVELLLNHGACLDVFNAYAKTALMLACAHGTWGTVKLLSQKSERCMATGYLEQTPLDYMLSVQANSPNCHPDIRIFNLLLKKGSDLHQVNHLGQSAAHHLLFNHSRVHLRSILSTDVRLALTQRIEWSRCQAGGYSQPQSNLIAATRNLRLLRHYLTDDELRKTWDLERPGEHGLFCTAACWGVVEAIQNFLLIGAGLEHQCREHGTPLVAAALFRKLEAVKVLVRKGAQIIYEEDGLGPMGITVDTCGWPVMHWLLVLRYTEQPKLVNTISNEPATKIFNWSGGATVKLPLKWEWKKRRDETMLEYAKRRQAIISKLRGGVLFVS